MELSAVEEVEARGGVEQHGPDHDPQDALTLPSSQAATHTPISLVNDTEIVDEDEHHYGEDFGDDEYMDEDEGHIEPNMVDADVLHGEKDRQFRSKVWREFLKVRVGGVVTKGECKYCKARITARRGSGTSAMGTHLKRCKARRKATEVVGQFKAAIMSPTGVRLRNWSFNQDVSRRELARMIVLHELPFSIVEYDGFRRFVSSLNPMFEMVSRKAIKGDCIKMYQEHRQALQDVLKNANSRISLTMDLWTSNQTLGYICITCHYLDHDWKMHKRILKFSFMKSPHTGIAMFNAVLKSMQEWNIEDKLFAITLDNASNNNAMMKLLKDNLKEKNMLLGNGRLLHQRCAAHVLNLICQAGFKSVNPIVHKVRESVKYIRGSQSRLQKFEEIVVQLGMTDEKRPSLDVCTRWNSTYTMLHTSLKLRKAFESLKLQDPQYTDLPTDEEWERVDLVRKLLEKFFTATKVVSGTLYPTSNLFFDEIWDVKVALDKAAIDTSDPDIDEVISYMKKKLNKYWKLSWLPLSIPVLLDPRFKYTYIEFRLKQAFGNEADMKLEMVRKAFLNLFKSYSQLNTAGQEVTQQVAAVQVLSEAEGRYADWDSHMSLRANSESEVPSELENYMKKLPIRRGGEFDILSWWRSNALEYPILSQMARDILVVPASSVASESAFSTGDRVISDFRSRLAPETVEALICLQDWLRSSNSTELSMEAINDFVEPEEEPL
ncbi:hypothetical protein ACP70R_036173 [Stipagrostis hirtigluma subsp. patula]